MSANGETLDGLRFSDMLKLLQTTIKPLTLVFQTNHANSVQTRGQHLPIQANPCQELRTSACDGADFTIHMNQIEERCQLATTNETEIASSELVGLSEASPLPLIEDSTSVVSVSSEWEPWFERPTA